MKNLISLFLILSNFLVAAQISGTVMNENNTSLEKVTILNLNQKTSAITNKNGMFFLTGKVGDSIRIQHVSCITKEFEVKDVDANYILLQKNVNIGEVTVTAKYAISLFRKSCINTFNSFKDKNVYQGYFRYTSTIDEDTTQIIDIDFDIVQKKLRTIEKGEKIKPYKIQERNEIQPTAPFCRTKPFFTYINQIYDWANFLGSSYSLKVEDSIQVKLYFIGKFQKVEVAIQKDDSCLVSVTIVSTYPFTNKEGVSVMNKKSYSKIEYAYEDGAGYIAEMSDILVLPNLKDNTKTLTFSQFYKTYNFETENLKQRPHGHPVIGNSWDPRLIKNRDPEMFLERNFINDIVTDSMDILESFSGLNMEENNDTHPSMKQYSSTSIRIYGIGFYK